MKIVEEDEDEELEDEEYWEYETESEDEAVDKEIERRKSLEDAHQTKLTEVRSVWMYHFYTHLTYVQFVNNYRVNKKPYWRVLTNAMVNTLSY